VYAEFADPFTFDSLQLPIVQPGGFVPFPLATIEPEHVTYVSSGNQVGALVPRGVYRVTWSMNPSEGAEVSLLMNGTQAGPFTKIVADGSVYVLQDVLVKAPHRHDNLIALQNTGSTLFTRGSLPNTRVGNTSVLTHILIERLSAKLD
jgi:hypothetical protein